MYARPKVSMCRNGCVYAFWKHCFLHAYNFHYLMPLKFVRQIQSFDKQFCDDYICLFKALHNKWTEGSSRSYYVCWSFIQRGCRYHILWHRSKVSFPILQFIFKILIKYLSDCANSLHRNYLLLMTSFYHIILFATQLITKLQCKFICFSNRFSTAVLTKLLEIFLLVFNKAWIQKNFNASIAHSCAPAHLKLSL